MRTSLLLAPIVLCVACSGGGSSHNGVATLGTTGTAGAGAATTTTTVKVSIQDATRLYDEWAACIRQHGVDLQDPSIDGTGTVSITIPPNTPPETFQAADQACQALHAAARAADGASAINKPDPQALVNFSKCMRAHGVRDFPDPSGLGLRIQSGPGSDLSPDNPVFANAQKVCQDQLPNHGHGGERISQTGGGPGGPGPVGPPGGGSGASSGGAG